MVYVPKGTGEPKSPPPNEGSSMAPPRGAPITFVPVGRMSAAIFGALEGEREVIVEGYRIADGETTLTLRILPRRSRA